MEIEYIDLEEYETKTVVIDDIYSNITEALEDVGYTYYKSLHCKRPRFYEHIYKYKGNYYIVKKVNYKNMYIFNIELANITKLIMESRW